MINDPSEFLNMYLDEDYSKPFMPLLPPPSPTAAGPYDFLGAFGALASSSSSATTSPSAYPQSNSPGNSPHAFSFSEDSSQLGIDPALVGTPSGSGSSPSNEFDADNDDDDDDGGDDDDEELDKVTLLPTTTIAPIKVGGKGKARKGTVASGGIKKPSPSLSSGKENLNKDNGSGDGKEDRESDDWRPSPEEYKKMSSKEKRQLRNKISARNFRVRRKEYISTLEADISERDALISAIRSELGSSKSENVALRQEIAALKRSLLSGRGVEEEGPVLPPPALLSPASTPSVAARASSPLLTPNTQKDLPTSPRLGVRGFWGGAAAGMGGGYTPVHTTFVPPLSVSSAVLARKHHTPSPPILLPLQPQENINPALNAPPPPVRVPSPPIINPSPFVNASANKINGLGGVGGGFDAFADMNPFTLKTLDAYRMQLWGKMAAQNHLYQHQQQQQQQPQQPQQLSGLARELRPQFFRDAHGFSGPLLAGKASFSSAAYPTPPASPLLGPHKGHGQREKEKEVQRDAMYAALASQTLLGKLGSAFWDAFSGGSSSSPSSSSLHSSVGGGAFNRQWDADKVRKVLEGKAVVRVVDVENVVDKKARVPIPVSVPVLGVGKKQEMVVGVGKEGKCMEKERGGEGAKCIVSDILEESMRSLSLGKK